MLDQLDGHLIASRALGRRPQVSLQAPGGTALCVAQHMTPHENEHELTNELFVYLTDYHNPTTISRLQTVPHVVQVLCDDEDDFANFYNSRCVVLPIVTGKQ